MKTIARSACVAVLSLLLAATASPAVAKGPTDVDVSGPGVDAAFGWTERGGDIDVGSLSEAARITHHWDGSGLGPSPSLTADELGPRYVLTWTVGRSHWAVQHAYPFAEGGAWVHFLSLPSEGPGGWVRAPGLERQLVTLGAGAQRHAPAAETVEPAAGVTELDGPAEAVGAAEPASTADPASSYDVVVAVGVLLAIAVLAGAVLVTRKRLLSRGRAVG